MPDALSEVKALLRNQGFEALMDNADKAASYCRSIGEAAYRGDSVTVGVHIRQLRAVCLAMIKTYKEDIGDEGLAGRQEGPALADRQDQRPGDGVARGQSE
jgi:hypothetical protein